MGLNVVSVDGVVIHETKTWIKRCYACFKTVPDVSKEFCPKCGNKTLKRVSVTLNADGTMKIHISSTSIRFQLPILTLQSKLLKIGYIAVCYRNSSIFS